MRVETKFLPASDLGKQVLQFSFHLDDDDKITSKTLNGGGTSEIKLGARRAHFHFPVEFKGPHPDLLAIAALKIISPYVGSRFVMDQPISEKTAIIIRLIYPWIKDVYFERHVTPRVTKKENPVISFSGGADSVAVAMIMPEDTPLVMAARTYHPDIGKFEPWTKASAPIGTMKAMPNDERKFLVHTDFPYLSTNGSYCIYPDTYAFTTPAIILADHLEVSHLVTGDIIAGLTGNETIFNPTLFPEKARGIFQGVSLDLECPCNGVSEIVTSKIIVESGMEKKSSSCEYGEFEKPCMECIKCLRKSLYVWALTGKELNQQQIDKFNKSKPIRNFVENTGRGGLSVMASFKWAFRKTGRHFDGLIGDIQNRAYSLDIPVSWAEKYYPPVYSRRPDFVMTTFEQLKRYCPPMTDMDMQDFSRLDWRKNFPKTIAPASKAVPQPDASAEKPKDTAVSEDTTDKGWRHKIGRILQRNSP